LTWSHFSLLSDRIFITHFFVITVAARRDPMLVATRKQEIFILDFFFP
jgi:hypothetical protein